VRIVHITAGAGGMYCGICLRDNRLVATLKRMGHDVLMVPLYLPLTLDETDQSAGTPIFFSGINVYLEQKSSFFRAMPSWLHGILRARPLLKWAAGRASGTRAQELGDITLSMLRGEEGHQARELNELLVWLRSLPKPDIICLSNVLLIGMARKLSADLACPVVCMLQGEDAFLDLLPEPYRAQSWAALAERARDVRLFGAASGYFGKTMTRRLSLPEGQTRVVYNGINLDGFDAAPARENLDSSRPPVLGFLSRMCREKGLDIVVATYIELRRRGRIRDLRLHIAGGCGKADEAVLAAAKADLERAGVLDAVEFHPNVTRSEKIEFLRGIDVFCVPSRAAEAFGLFIVEAMAAGVPAVEPPTGAFPEIIEATGGGVLAMSASPKDLSETIEEVLLDPERARAIGQRGKEAVKEKFSAEAMARNVLAFYEEAIRPITKPNDASRFAQ
jgi:glycosyltransferase involved in cell wall biosynthesis